MTSREVDFWQKRRQEAQTGWDLGAPHPLTPRLWQLARPFLPDPEKAQRIYSPGCGRAHDAAYFAKLGHKTVGADFSPGAIEQAQLAYGHLEHLELIVADAMVCSRVEQDAYDIIFDRAMLCALRPELRPAFLQACWERLRPGGLFLSIPFSQVSGLAGSGPPFAIPKDTLLGYFAPKWAVFHYSPDTTGACDDRILEEALLVTAAKKT